jgi:hypothetical protein
MFPKKPESAYTNPVSGGAKLFFPRNEIVTV